MLRNRDEAIEIINNRISQLMRLHHGYQHLNDLDLEHSTDKLNTINEFYSFLVCCINEINHDANYDLSSSKSNDEFKKLLKITENTYPNTPFSHMEKLSEMWGGKVTLTFILDMTEKMITQSTNSINSLVSWNIKTINESINELNKLNHYYSQLKLPDSDKKSEEIAQIKEILNFYATDLEAYLYELNNHLPLHFLAGEFNQQFQKVEEYISSVNKTILDHLSEKIDIATTQYLQENHASEYYISKNDNVYFVKDKKGLINKDLINKDKKVSPGSHMSIIFLMKENLDLFKEKLMSEKNLTSKIIENKTQYSVEDLVKFTQESEHHKIDSSPNQLIDLENEDKEELENLTLQKKSLKKTINSAMRSKTENKISQRQKKIEKRTSTLSSRSQINPLSGNKSQKFVKYANKLNKYGDDFSYTANIANRTVSEGANRTSISYDYNRGKGHKEKTITVTQDVIINQNEVKSQLTSDVAKLKKLDSNQARFAAMKWVEDALEKTPKDNKVTITLEKYGALSKDFIKTVVFYCQENGHKIHLIPDNRQLTQLTEKDKKELRQFFDNRNLLTVSQPAANDRAPLMKIQQEKK